MNRRDKLDQIPIYERFLLDEDSASIMLAVSRQTFREWKDAGLVKPVKLPGNPMRNLYLREAIEEFAKALHAAAI